MKIKLRGFSTYFFLFLSLCILFLSGYVIVRLRYHEIEGLFPSLTKEQQRQYISGYLSYFTRSKLAHDALIILEEEKDRLANTQREVEELETSMESFLKAMDEKQAVFEANVSTFNIEDLIKDLRAAIHINKYNELFNSELNKRKQRFFENYTSKKTRLVNEKHIEENRISELSHYIEAVQHKGSEELISADGLPFIKETQKLQIERVVFFIKHEEYKKAADVLQRIIDTGFDDYGLLEVLLTTLDALERRRVQLSTEDHLIDLKLSYLSEDYEKALTQVDELDSDPYLRPLLGMLNAALYRNIEVACDIDNDLNVMNDVKSLIAMASMLEQSGEFKKAVGLYRKLLLLDLPPHDREYLASKLYSAMELSIKSELKRRDNTMAIKFLENARRLVWEGKKDEALQQYLLLIKECPNSDYVGQAVGEIVALRG